MADNTKIEWCDATWSPITGCSPISEGCQNCYAKRVARRLAGRFGYPQAPNHFNVTFHSGYVYWKPKKWKKSRRVFVCSMGDLFHCDVDVDGFVFDSIFNLMMQYVPQHTYMLLTKRPKKMQWVVERLFHNNITSNIWLGVTAENQKRADERIPILLQIPAAVRFVSVEPMLSEVDLYHYLYPIGAGPTTTPCLDWVIAGPETGPGARECKPEWIEDLYEECKAAGIPFFDKRKNYIAREFPV